MSELLIALFGFLLNLPWELLQVPLYRGLGASSHREGILVCVRAAAGDAGIAVAAFWIVSLSCRSREWLRHPGPMQVVGFTAVGLVITVLIEAWATQVAGRWGYAEAMPVVPLLGTGLAPFLQWLVIPPGVLWLAGRQLRGPGSR